MVDQHALDEIGRLRAKLREADETIDALREHIQSQLARAQHCQKNPSHHSFVWTCSDCLNARNKLRERRDDLLEQAISRALASLDSGGYSAARTVLFLALRGGS